MALSGVAYTRLEQFPKAETALNNACAMCPDALLAWQALVDLYEKYGDKFLDLQHKLSVAYKKFISLSTLDAPKKLEYTFKLVDCLTRIDGHVEAVQLLLDSSFPSDSEPARLSRSVVALADFEDVCIKKFKTRILGVSQMQVGVFDFDTHSVKAKFSVLRENPQACAMRHATFARLLSCSRESAVKVKPESLHYTTRLAAPSIDTTHNCSSRILFQSFLPLRCSLDSKVFNFFSDMIF
jgi:hypothetical protein